MRLLAFFTSMIIAKGEKQEKTPLSRFEVGKKKMPAEPAGLYGHS